MKRIFRRVEGMTVTRLLDVYDGIIDRRICGKSLVKCAPSIDENEADATGGTRSESTHYLTLRKMFEHVKLTPSDAVCDIGCGKGRVLAFLIREKSPCLIYGIEHNPDVAKIAERWSRQYDKIIIKSGDAFAEDYNPYTVLTLGRSFLPQTMVAFVQYLEKTLNHSITLLSWYDHRGYPLLKERPGWTALYRGKIGRIHGIWIYPAPITYTVWLYEPETGKKMNK